MSHRSQLLNRLVECQFGYTDDNGIVIGHYLRITLAINWTYSGSLHIPTQKGTSIRLTNYASTFSEQGKGRGGRGGGGGLEFLL